MTQWRLSTRNISPRCVGGVVPIENRSGGFVCRRGGRRVGQQPALSRSNRAISLDHLADMGKVIGFRRPQPYRRRRSNRTNTGRVGFDRCGGRGSAGWNTCFRSRFSNGRIGRQRQRQPEYRRMDLSRCRPGSIGSKESVGSARRPMLKRPGGEEHCVEATASRSDRI